MIVHPARHLFEAKFPSLEDHEDEIFFPHPVHNLQVNQLGAIYCDDSEYGIYDKTGWSIIREHKTLKNCGTKLRVIWECYHGRIVPGAHFLFANGNPLDTRKENLILSTNLPIKERNTYLSRKSRFVQASVEHLIKIEARMERQGVDKEQVHKILQLPYWLKTEREKFRAPASKEERLVRRGGSKSKTTVDEADEIERLFHMGLTYYAILDRMGWRSTSRIKKVVRDRGLVR